MNTVDLTREHLDMLQKRLRVQGGGQAESLGFAVCEWMDELYENCRVSIPTTGPDAPAVLFIVKSFLQEQCIGFQMVEDEMQVNITLSIEMEEAIRIEGNPGNFSPKMMEAIYSKMETLRAVLLVESGMKIVGFAPTLEAIEAVAVAQGLCCEKVPFSYLPTRI